MYNICGAAPNALIEGVVTAIFPYGNVAEGNFNFFQKEKPP